MAVVHAVNQTILNRLRMATDAGAVTPGIGTSVDANSGFGQLVIGTASLSGATGVLVTITLQKPSFSYFGVTATMLGVPLSAVATATGTAAMAYLSDSAGTVIISGLTVGTSGTDIMLVSASISAGQTVTINSATIVGV